MSTDAHDRDIDAIEYGSTPADASREYTDIEPSIAWKFAIWLGVAMLISAGIVYGAFWFFEGRAQTADRATRVFPLAAGQVKEPPGPRLQTQPFKDLYLLRQNERERMTTYGWVDKGTQTTHIPIDQAMDLVLQRGILHAGPQPATAGIVVSDSSAGRVAVTR